MCSLFKYKQGKRISKGKVEPVNHESTVVKEAKEKCFKKKTLLLTKSCQLIQILGRIRRLKTFAHLGDSDPW